ncbi:O-antigen ligase family protein [Candidatus Nitrosacidococcus tergens]|uniref:Binding-protein-dependent transport system protein n=1 Tax=Candidatus Nitrosacidococcus tergens TaxID=553981 RepID=A0A7G1Q977_9GAMM|nr:O-antigen ligase family protein [Candidatus Nitrosacidococcus tergens]CAB1275795.1 Binding-protein-dependent transport system protein [Candidatus Nitrosacidococcus tergens]
MFRAKKKQKITFSERAILIGIALIPLIQLIPLPIEILSKLFPGRAFYADNITQTLNQDDISNRWHSIALIPSATELAWLALLPPIAVFISTRYMTSQQLKKLTYLFLGIASFEAILGLIQYGEGSENLFRLGNEYYRDSAVGTYVNRNHLAGLLEMVLPIVLSILIAVIKKNPNITSNKDRGSWHQLLLRWSNNQGNYFLLFFTIAIIILLGTIFTRSRTGIMLVMLGLILSFFVFIRKIDLKKLYGTAGFIIFSSLIFAFEIGLTPIFNRFAAIDENMEKGRGLIYSGTLQAINEFFPLGSGAGSFAEVFQRFQPIDFTAGYVHRAHNDYLEWILVGGLPAAILIVASLFVYGRRWIKVWRWEQESIFYFIQIGAGIGTLLLLFHTLVDFNLHIPANAIFFAFLLGVFFYPLEQQQIRSKKNKPTASLPYYPPKPKEIPKENLANPFD